MTRNENIWICITYYVPGYKNGGPVTSVKNLCAQLSDYYRFSILTTNKDQGEKKPYPNIKSKTWLKQGNNQIIYFSYKTYLINIVLNIIRAKPRIIYYNGVLSLNFFSGVLLKKIMNSKIKIIVAPRGELNVIALSMKTFKKMAFLRILRIFSKDIIFHALTEEEKIEIKRIFKNNLVYVCPNLPDVPNQNILEKTKSKKKHELNVLFLSRICENKNLSFVIETLSCISDKYKINFKIVGPIEDVNYWRKCENMLKKLPKNINYIYQGAQSHEIIFKNYLENDILFLPTYFESFGHVIQESRSYGCPVLISTNTPLQNGGSHMGVFALDLSRRELFIQIINEFCELDASEFKDIRRITREYSLAGLNMAEIVDKYNRMFSLE